MLGMLEINKSIRKIQIDYKKINDNKILSVQIPSLRKRHMKKAEKLLKGKRVIIEDEWDENALSKWGISPISPKKLNRYLTGEIYKKLLAQFKIPPDKAYVSIKAGRIGSAERFGLDEIIKNARHISFSSSDSVELSQYIFENYGISPIKYESRANIVINMYETEFSICFKSERGIFNLKDISIMKDGRFCEIPSTHLKSACLALIERGSLGEDEIGIEKLHFMLEN